MDCKDCKEKLSAYIDNELSFKERQLVKKHLQFCSSCDDEKEKLLMISSLMDKVLVEEIPPYFKESTVNKIKSDIGEPRKYHILRPVFAGLLAVGILIGTMVGSTFNINNKPKTSYYPYLKNFDDFPPESLSRIYVSAITGDSK